MKTCAHFEVFFEKYLEENPSEGLRIFGTPDEEKWELDLNHFSDDSLHEINISVADQYALYLATATALDRISTPHKKYYLSYGTSARYLSAFKCGIQQLLLYSQKFKPLSNDTDMQTIRKGMLSLIVKRCMQDQEALSTSHVSASFEDIKVIAIICIWKNDAKSANLLFFLLALYFFSGRAFEIACIPFRRTKMIQPVEFTEEDALCQDKVLEHNIWRTKTHHETKVTVFNHKENFLLDYYFAMALSMLTTRTASPNLFHRFAKVGMNDSQAGNTPANDRSTNEGADAEDSADNNAAGAGGIPPPPGIGPGASASAAGIGSVSDTEGNRITGLFNKCMADLIAAGTDLERAQEASDSEVGPDSPEANVSFVPSKQDKDKGTFQFNPKITSHSPKRFAVNLISSVTSIKTTWAVIAHGWQLKALHTIFDYLDFKRESLDQVSLAKAGWTTPMPWPGGRIGGGKPPSLRALKRTADPSLPGVDPPNATLSAFDYDFARAMSQQLFEKYAGTEGANDPELWELLTATSIMHLPKFVQLLTEHPEGFATGQFSQAPNDPVNCMVTHLFTRELIVAFQSTCESYVQPNGVRHPTPNYASIKEVLFRWAESINLDFVERNFMFVSDQQINAIDLPPVEQGTPHDYSAIRGIRSIGGYLNGFGRALCNINTSLYHVMCHVCNLCRSLKHAITTLDRMERKLERLERTVNLAVQILAEQGGNKGNKLSSNLRKAALNARRGIAPEAFPPDPHNRPTAPAGDLSGEEPEPDDAVEPVQVMRRQLTSLSDYNVKQLFVAWHHERYYEYTYQPGSSKSVRQNRNTAKFVVEYFSLFLSEQVPPLKEGESLGTADTRYHRTILTEMAEQAWQAYVTFHATHKTKSQTACKPALTSFKDFMSKVPHALWPVGPTGESPFQHPLHLQQPDMKLKDRAALVMHQSALKTKRDAAVAALDGQPTATPQKKSRKTTPRKQSKTTAAQATPPDEEREQSTYV